ncbi:MAG: VWA domain-containing protein, partial [Myxococcales bacterium]
MEARIAEFAGLLRQNGLRVSPAEVADAARAVLAVGLEERGPFRGALRAALVKRGSDAAVFDRLFDLYFVGIKDLLEGLQGSLLRALDAEKLSADELEQVAEELSRMQLSALTEALVQGRTDDLARLLRTAMQDVDFRGLTSPLQRGFYSRRLLQAAGGTRAEQELQAFVARLKEGGLDPRSLDLVSKRVSSTMKGLEEAAKRVADREQKARDPERKGENALLHRNLASLTPQEIERMRDVVRRLAERLKSRLSRRRKTRRKGALSVRRTLRKNLATGGFPAKLVFRSRRAERPEVLVLCDVSDSVRNVSRL